MKIDHVILALACLMGVLSMLRDCSSYAHAQRSECTVYQEQEVVLFSPFDDPPTPVAEIDDVKHEALWLARLYRHEAGFPRRAPRCTWNPRRRPGELVECRAAHRTRPSFVLGDDMAAMNEVIERVQGVMQRARDRRAASGKGSEDDVAGRPVTYVDAISAYTRKRIFDRTQTDADCDTPFLDLEGNEPECWPSDIPWSNRRDAWLLAVAAAIDVRRGNVSSRCERPPLHWGCGPALSLPPRGTGTCRDHLRAARAGWVEISCGDTDNTFYADPLPGGIE